MSDREPKREAAAPGAPASALDTTAELALVSYAARLLLSQRDRRLLLEHGLETFLDFARGRSGAVYLLDHDGARLRLVCGSPVDVEGRRGESGAADARELEVTESPWCDCLAERLPLSFRIGGTASPGRECLCVPLIGAANRVFGLAAIERDPGDPLEEARTQSLLVLQSILALGLEQAAARERLLEANEELEALHAAKSKMIDHLSHELKTPLAVLTASSALLGRAAVRQEERRAASVLERMDRSIARLLELQEEACDIARIGADATAAQDIALDRWVPEVLASMAPLHGHRAVRIEAALEPTPTLVLPEPLLRKTLIGLVRNAVEATRDGGWVRVSAGRRGADLVLEVADSGCGFDAATRKQLFHGFVHAGETRDYSSGRPYDFGAGGRGLDLLRTRHFADRHGFAIEVESEPGKGSRFRLVFPPALLRSVPPAAPPPGSPPSAAPSR